MSIALVDPLLEPFQLKHVTLRNRVVSTSHEPAYGDRGLAKDRYRLYHVEKAKGGCGLTMIGTSMVGTDSPSSFGSNLQLHKDETVDYLKKLSDDVHEYGTAVMLQVTHLGRRTSPYSGEWLPVISPSNSPEPFHRSYPKRAEQWDLDRIIADYAAAALRCKEGGLDGIEIESYGHLFDAFLSPWINDRNDEYGGDLENRMRFPVEVIRAIRAAVGTEFIVGIRMSVDEARPDGMDFDEGLLALKRFTDEGIDFLSVIKGTIESDEALARVIPPMGTPSSPFLDFAGHVRSIVDIPVMHAARIADVATARYAVREGLLDLVGMTRAQMADPHLVNKIASGQAERIRPCVGATFCLDALHRTGDSKCIHNPSTGREGLLPNIIEPTSGPIKKAVVIGAGPGGLEAARVLGERGHKVVVFEANEKAGGQIAIAANSKRRRDLIGIVDWRVSELTHSNVEVRYGVYATAADVQAESPDVVIVATGGLPNHDLLPEGGDLVLDSWDIQSAVDRTHEGEVLVFDFSGWHPGLDTVETLVAGGSHVEYVTPARTIAPEVGPLTSPGYLKTFAQHKVVTTLNMSLTAVRRSDDGRLVASLYNEYADLTEERVVDHVVVEYGTLPNDELYFDLLHGSTNRGEVDNEAFVAVQPQTIVRNLEGRYQLFRLGDAVSSRNIHSAIFDAMRFCLPV